MLYIPTLIGLAATSLICLRLSKYCFDRWNPDGSMKSGTPGAIGGLLLVTGTAALVAGVIVGTDMASNTPATWPIAIVNGAGWLLFYEAVLVPLTKSDPDNL